MEIFVDRRNDRHCRINTDSSVELVHEDFEEPFEADCVDLSPGGAAVRASCLPEVGTSFICRFEGNDGGQSVEVLGTVVWAHLEGDRKGEFGLRFLDVDERTEELIAAMLRESGIEPEPSPLGREVDAGTDDSVSQLYLDGVPTPIAARITRSIDGMTTFEQELSLLRIERGVSARHPGGQPRRGTIADVQLLVEDDTPKLVITVRHQDREPEDAVVAEPVEAIEGALPLDAERTAALPPEPEAAAACASEPEAEPDDEGLASWEPVIASFEKPERLPSEIGAPEPEPVRSAQQPAESGTASSSRDLFALGEGEEDDPWPADHLSSLRASARVYLRHCLDALAWLKATLLPVAGTLSSRLREQTLPALFLGASGAREATRSFWQKRVLPLLLSGARAFRLPRPFQRRRRTTAFVAQSERSESSRGRSWKQRTFSVGRALLLPALAIGGGLLAAYGFGTWWSGDAAIPLHRPVDAEARTEQRVESETAPPSEPTVKERVPHTENKSIASAGEVNGVRPEAVEAPASADQPAPAASAQDEAAATAAAAEEKGAPESRRAAGKARGPVFGSRKLNGGRNYMLRMSRKIEQLRGTPDPGGFTVIIPGSLSFDPAGPIAATHPLVRRSLILNKGDHAALTVRFAKGASPAYRVSAVGSSLHISIAESG